MGLKRMGTLPPNPIGIQFTTDNMDKYRIVDFLDNIVYYFPLDSKNNKAYTVRKSVIEDSTFKLEEEVK